MDAAAKVAVDAGMEARRGIREGKGERDDEDWESKRRKVALKVFMAGLLGSSPEGRGFGAFSYGL